MDFQQHIPFISIFISIIMSIITAIFRKSIFAKVLNVISLVSIIILSGILVYYFIDSDVSHFVYNLGATTSPWVNTLSASLVEAVLSLVFAIVMLLSILGGIKETNQDIPDSKQFLYYISHGLLFASLLVLTYTNDIFTGYVFLEINALVACMIIILKEEGATLRATIKYFIMSAVGSGLFLFAIAMLYGITGHLAMDGLNVTIKALADSGEFYIPLLVSFVLFFVSLGIKSALFPFHNWLPDAHSSATSTSSAVLSGIVLKGYIILFMKIVYKVYSIEVVQTLNVLPIILGVGVASMIFGSIFALLQNDIKKMIAYSSVAQIGYIFTGIGLGTTAGITTALFHIVGHSVTKPALFLSAGKVISTYHIKDVKKFNGIGNKMPLVMAVFTIASLSMIGIPPSVGFSSKWYLASASLGTNKNWMIIIITLSSLLNIAYYLPIIIRSFFGKKADELPANPIQTKDIGYPMLIIFAMLIIGLGLYSGVVMELFQKGFSTW